MKASQAKEPVANRDHGAPPQPQPQGGSGEGAASAFARMQSQHDHRARHRPADDTRTGAYPEKKP